MDKQLTIKEALDAFPTNPEAGALALGMVLMQGSRDEVDRITKLIDEDNQQRIEELEKEVDFWKPLGRKWLQLKKLLADENERDF